jgi:hypothetical protein
MALFLVRLFSLPFIALGAMVLYIGLQEIFHGLQSNNWVEVEGKIISSAIVPKPKDGSRTNYLADVRYEYLHNGQKLSGNRIAIGLIESSDPSKARAILHSYPVGTGVSVYLSPSDPAEAVLEKGISLDTLLMPGLGLVFLVVGIWCFCSAHRLARRDRESRKPMTRRQCKVLASLFTLVGASMFMFGVKHVFYAEQCMEWPTVEGRVIRSAVELIRGGKGGTSYDSEVFYEYQIEGRTYSSNGVRFGDLGSGTDSNARTVVDRYPTGAKVVVFVSPENPAESVLEPGRSGQTFLLPGVGVLFVLIGLVAFRLLPLFI